jgi:hypothetical protein
MQLVMKVSEVFAAFYYPSGQCQPVNGLSFSALLFRAGV